MVMSDRIDIQCTRFSAGDSPLIATIAGGVLKDEGLTPAGLGTDIAKRLGPIAKRHRDEDVVAAPPVA